MTPKKAKVVENILTERRKEEVASCVLQKHEKDFVEKEMRLLTISHIGDQIVISGDQRTVGRVLKVPSNVDFLVNLMSNEVGEGESKAFEHMTSKKLDIPPLFCQVR